MKAPRELSSPFPFFGGKSRLAAQIWAKLGNPTVYVEPFAGSLACLLARPDGPGQREIVCDLDGGIVNFWRAVTAEPDLVAYWADYPTFHADLTARHKWLRAWFAEHTAELSNDPHFYCAKVAGWWVWGISLWIGGGWCNEVSTRKDGEPWDQVPMSRAGGQGVNAQRVWDVRPAVTSANGVSAQAQRAQPDQIPKIIKNVGGAGVSAQGTRATQDKIPYVQHWPGGQGVSAQHTNLPFVKDKIPKVDPRGGGQRVSAQSSRATPDQRPFSSVSGGGQGVSAQRINTPDSRPHAARKPGGQGVSAQRLTVPNQIPWVDAHGGGRGTTERQTRPDLVDWFRAIQERFEGRYRPEPGLGKCANAHVADAHSDIAQAARWHPARPAVPDHRPAIGTVRIGRRRQQQRRGNRRVCVGHRQRG